MIIEDRRFKQSPRLSLRDRKYPSLASFYKADPRRGSSRERDVGLWWREQPDGPLHRAAWIEDTGELYVTRLGPAEKGGGAVEVLAVEHDRDRLLALVSGWRERCGAPRSLNWLRERSAPLRAPLPASGGRPPRRRARKSAPRARSSNDATGAGAGKLPAARAQVPREPSWRARPSSGIGSHAAAFSTN